MLLARFPHPDPEVVRRRLTRLFRLASRETPSGRTPPAGSTVDPLPPRASSLDTRSGTPPDERPTLDTADPGPDRSATDRVRSLEGRVPSPEEQARAGAEHVGSDSGTTIPNGRLSGRFAAAFGVDRAQIDPGRPGTRALAALAVVVVLIAAVIAWWSQPRPEPVAPRAAAPTTRPSDSATGVVVAVAGKVRKPGLVTLPAGARVSDAIKAAGGVVPGTDIGYLNLARKVTDGELIVVGASAPPDAGAPGGSVAGAPPGNPAGKVSLNQATLQQLDTLPGVGPVLAQRIVDYRDEHGGFRSVDELRQVDGIGPARYEQLKDLVTV